MKLFDFAVRRIAGRIDLHNEMFKKAAQPEEAGHRQLPRETCHSLKEIAKDQNPDFVEVHRDMLSANNPLKVVPNSVFYALNPKRMANSRMKDADVGARINPTFNRSARWRMPPAKANIDDGGPF